MLLSIIPVYSTYYTTATNKVQTKIYHILKGGDAHGFSSKNQRLVEREHHYCKLVTASMT